MGENKRGAHESLINSRNEAEEPLLFGGSALSFWLARAISPLPNRLWGGDRTSTKIDTMAPKMRQTRNYCFL